MDEKKILGMQVTISIVITFLACVILSVFFFRKVSFLQRQIINSTSTTTTVNTSNLQATLLSVISGASQSVVSISLRKDLKSYVQDPSQVNSPGTVVTTQLGGASGILISKDGYVLTNKHVVENTGTQYSVTLYDGRRYSVANIWFDDALDLAILKIVGDQGATLDNLPVAHFIPFDQMIPVGTFVLAIGNSYNQYPNSVTFGILSAQSRTFKINQTNVYAGLYQTDASLTPGNSGGPLLDLQGNVLGINTATTDTQGIGFALPVSQEFIATTLASLVKYGKIVRPLLGLQYVDITPTLQQEKSLTVNAGVLVKDVLSGLPASEAGLQSGDVIISINQKPITSQLPLLYHIYTYLPGTTLSFSVLRAGSVLTLPVVLGENGN